jgi:predicted NUDIX family NTP pyrophosphohydrolase
MILDSAGVLSFRFKDNRLEVMLVHPGGPFWAGKDERGWSIPKGIFEEGESPLEAAKREFFEETGCQIDGKFIYLGEIKQPSRKIVHIWALEKDLDETEVVSNTFAMEWPKKSGIMKEYPEIDKASWFDVIQAKEKLHKGQVGFIDRLIEALSYKPKNMDREGGKIHEKNIDIQKGKDSSSQPQLTWWLQD